MSSFKIIHLVSSIDVSTGGPARSITGIAQGIIDNSSWKCTILTGESSQPEISLLSKPNETLEFFQIGKLGRLKNFNVSKLAEDKTVLHVHGLWELSTNQLCSGAVKKKLPYVISPHGMLEPWALKQSSIKKKIALWIYQYKDLQNAACIHATSLKEAENIRKLGLPNPIAVIPNGINLQGLIPVFEPVNFNKKKLLFLSRMYPGKGIENLFLAWKELSESIKENWTLEIIGEGELNYVKGLQNQMELLNIQHQVKFVGPLYNEEKNLAYQSADLFVLPTYSENFGMVIAEAMAFGLPVITTKGAPWEELETHNAGWWIDIGVEPLTKALTEAMNTPNAKLIEMGKNGRQLIEQKYSVENVAKQMIELYEWILHKRDKPDFVI